ncbi:MAG: hypothetical protein U9N53_11630, partial [Bacteroidota bacterium]|nr:hypothetical protein [Bacteroidota bacterium]
RKNAINTGLYANGLLSTALKLMKKFNLDTIVIIHILYQYSFRCLNSTNPSNSVQIEHFPQDQDTCQSYCY